MITPKFLRGLGAVIALTALPTIAMAQTQTTPDTQPTTPPAATKPDAGAPPPAPPAQKPMPAPQREKTDKSVTAPNAVNPLVGLAVFSSDGSKLGNVQRVQSTPDGKVTALHIKSGGFLGFGGKMVAIPEGKFTRAGDNIQLGMTAEEVSKLPEVKDQS